MTKASCKSSMLGTGFMRSRSFSIIAFLLALITPSIAAQNLRLTLAAQPPAVGTISTRAANRLSLTTLSGHSVSFAREQGRDYTLQAGGGFSWTQVQEVPQDADVVSIKPVVNEDGSVEVSVDVARKQGTSQQSYRSTVLAQPGEWVQLFGPSPSTAARGVKVYGTQQVSAESLYLLVEPMEY